MISGLTHMRRLGCCKTTLARAAATASGATMVELSGAQLFSMYVGEGEALLRGAFQRARLAAPSILFLDELDALVGAGQSLSFLPSNPKLKPLSLGPCRPYTPDQHLTDSPRLQSGVGGLRMWC